MITFEAKKMNDLELRILAERIYEAVTGKFVTSDRDGDKILDRIERVLREELTS